jgi:hypothetical protein
MSQTNARHHPIVHIERPDPDLSVRNVSSPTSPLEVIASDWSELTALRNLQLLDASCNYIMVGQDATERLLARVGEASKPWPRLGDHRYDRSLTWADQLFIIVNRTRHWEKSDVVAFQEVLSDEVERVESAHLHAGVGPLRLPAASIKRAVTEILLADARKLLADAGCPVLTPRRRSLQCMLATSAELMLAH